jgi:6-phosphogluconolactonase
MISRFLLLIFFLLCCSGTVPAQQTLVFAGSFNRDKNKEGIQVLRLDVKSGLLKKVSALKGILNPSYLTLSENGKFLYACIETQTKGSGSIMAFKVDPVTGSLNILNRQKSSGENPVYITLEQSGRYLFSVNYTEAGIDVFPLDADGRIGTAVQTIAYDKGSHVTTRQEQAHTHSLHLSTGQDHVFIPDLGSDVIRCYDLDMAAPKPIREQTQVMIKSPPGSGPRHFTFHPHGKYAYCIEEISGTLTAYTYKHGQLQDLQHIPAHKDSLEGYNSADIHISPDGRFLYASNRGDENNIAIFALQENGTLRHIAYQSVLGEHPRIFAIDATGKFLIVANQVSGNIVVFRRNKKSGFLSPVRQNVNVENVSCVQIKKYDQ